MDIGTIIAVIWPYLAALYFLDCLLVVRGGRLLLAGLSPSELRTLGPGLRLAGVLPWEWSVLATRDPVVLSEAGLYSRLQPGPLPLRPPRPDDFRFTPWEEAADVRREGSRVTVGGETALVCATGVEADSHLLRILRIRDLPPAERGSALADDMAAAADAQAIGERVRGVKAATTLLRASSAALFLLTLAVVPGSLLLRAPFALLWAEVFAFLALWLAVAVLWWRAHRTLLPEASGDRLEETLVLLLFPVSTLHAFGKLTRRLFGPFDSTALMATMAPSSASGELVREHIRARAAASSGGGGDFTEAWSMRVRSLEELARRSGVDLSPDRLHRNGGGSGEAVCPLCGAGYRQGVLQCSDCGVPLLKTPPEAT
ncbi:MAG: hypothetical protein JSV00_01905 [bacterium]|nr:MAG: hypothetical protein JSV00_01905 [bacterium]